MYKSNPEVRDEDGVAYEEVLHTFELLFTLFSSRVELLPHRQILKQLQSSYSSTCRQREASALDEEGLPISKGTQSVINPF